MAAVHGLYGVEIGASKIGGVTQQDLGIDTTFSAEVTDGEVFQRFQAIRQQQQNPSFTTVSIAEALDAVGTTGVQVTTGSVVNAYAQKWAAGGQRASTLAHRKFTYTEGIAVPRSLTVTDGGDATIQIAVGVAYDGTNDPVIITESQTLPTGLTQTERFGMGPVTIGAAALSNVAQWTLDFGLSFHFEFGDGSIYPTAVYIMTGEPTLTLDTADPLTVTAAKVAIDGLSATHANTTLHLRKRVSGGLYSTSADNIDLTMAGLATPTNMISASGSNPGMTSIQLIGLYDGTNAPVTADTAAAAV